MLRGEAQDREDFARLILQQGRQRSGRSGGSAERARRMIERQQIYLVQRRPDLGIGSRPSKSTLAVVSTISVAPGREAEIEQLLNAHAALRKVGVEYYGVSRVVYGATQATTSPC